MFDKQKLREIRQQKESWEKEILPESLSKLPEKGEFLTSFNIPVSRIYTPVDIADFDYLRDLGFPGEYPLTRCVYPTMYRGKILDYEAVCWLWHRGTNK